MRVETRRLLLFPATLESLRAELAGPAALAKVLRVEVRENWLPALFGPGPVESMIARLERTPEEVDWWLWYFVRRSSAEGGEILIGCGGFKGLPTTDGTVEIGGAVLEELRCQGYATEAAEGLVGHAFARGEVQRVIARTRLDLVPAIRVVERCGFRLVGEGSKPGEVRYELLRQAWQKRGGVAVGT